MGRGDGEGRVSRFVAIAFAMPAPARATRLDHLAWEVTKCRSIYDSKYPLIYS